MQTYKDLQDATSDLRSARQTLAEDEELEIGQVLELIDSHSSLIKYLDLEAKNYGITARALAEASQVLVQTRINDNLAIIAGIDAEIADQKVKLSQITIVYNLAIAIKWLSRARLDSIKANLYETQASIRGLKEQRSNVLKLNTLLENYTIKTEKASSATQAFTYSLKKSALEFKNMNELVEESNTVVSQLRDTIKALEKDMTDADLSTIATLAEHIKAYDEIKGALLGQASLQESLKQEALTGLTQILAGLDKNIIGININDIIIDGRVDNTKFNNLANFLKEEVNRLNAIMNRGKGTKELQEQLKLYHTLYSEVESYKDAIEKADLAIYKTNQTLTKTIEDQQAFYEKLVISQLEYIQDILVEKYEAALELIKEGNEASVEAIEKEKDAWEKLLEQQRERLKIDKDLRDSERERRDILIEIGDKQALLNKLALDESQFAKKRKKQLTEGITKNREKLTDIEYDRSYESKLGSLESLNKIRQEEFITRLTELEQSLAFEEARYEVLLTQRNIEKSAEALLLAKGTIISFTGEVMTLDSLVQEFGETLSKTGTREQLEGFNKFNEEIVAINDLLNEMGVVYEDVVIDWSQIKTANLADFEADLIGAAEKVGLSFSDSLLEQFKLGTIKLTTQFGTAATEMETAVGEYANSILKIYKSMLNDMVFGAKETGKNIGAALEDGTAEEMDIAEAVFGREGEGKGLLDEAYWEGRNIDFAVIQGIKDSRKKGGTSTWVITPGSDENDSAPTGDGVWRPPRDLGIVGYHNGGMVNFDGIAAVHGESSPEWIFNSNQLESVIKMTNASMLGTLSKLNIPLGGTGVTIENLIKIEGNATENTIIELKKLAKQIAPIVGKQLVKQIKKV